MDTRQFDGMTAVVTGGAQGIGEAVAQRLQKGGAQIAVWDMDGDLAERTAGTLPVPQLRASGTGGAARRPAQAEESWAEF